MEKEKARPKKDAVLMVRFESALKDRIEQQARKERISAAAVIRNAVRSILK